MTQVTPLGEAIAVAQWDSGRRWIVEWADLRPTDDIVAGHDEATLVAVLLSQLVTDEGSPAAEVSISGDWLTVTAYGPPPVGGEDSRPAGIVSGAEGPSAITTPGRTGGVPGAGVTPASTTDPVSVADQAAESMMRRLFAGLAGGAAALPTTTGLVFHKPPCPDPIRAWAALLGLPTPTYSDVKVLPGHDLYRVLKSVGHFAGHNVEVTGYIDIAADSSGLEGSGWLDEVWVAAERKGVAAHRPTQERGVDADASVPGPELTACGRSMRTGTRTTARQALGRWGAGFGCATCWPAGSPITVDTTGEVS